MTSRVAVVIATKNRPKYLPDLFRCLALQTLEPTHVVLVDSSDDEARPLVREACDFAELPIRYLGSSVSSSAVQRNAGIKELTLMSPAVDYIAVLDDDTRPDLNYFSSLIHLLERAGPSCAGASGTTGWVTPNRSLPARLYRRLFLLQGNYDGKVLRSGFGMGVDPSNPRIVAAEWLIGCAIWRADVLGAFHFRADLPGTALAEDLEMSRRIGREYRLLVDTEVILQHLAAPEGRPDTELFAHRSVRNRYTVVQAAGGSTIDVLAFWWSVVGLVLPLLYLSIFPRDHDVDYRKTLSGVIRGARAVLMREAPR